MTKLHFIHDWRVIAEKNIYLPYKYVYGSGYALCSDVNNSWSNRREFNVQILRCWKCDKMKHKIIDSEGKNWSSDLQLWVVKSLLGLGPENDKDTPVS